MKLSFIFTFSNNERVISDPATPVEIEIALKNIQTYEVYKLSSENGSSISVEISIADNKYLLSLFEVSRTGAATKYFNDGEVDTLDKVINAFHYFLNGSPKLGEEFTWTDTESVDTSIDSSISKNELPNVSGSNFSDALKEIHINFLKDRIHFFRDSKRDAAFFEEVLLKSGQLTAKELQAEVNQAIEKHTKYVDDDIQNLRKEISKQIIEPVTSHQSIYETQAPKYLPTGSSIWSHGVTNDKIICPQCNEKGCVHVKKVNKKAGVSGGKATAAILTGGISLFVAGLSRKEKLTEAYCGNCKSTWYF